MDTTTPTKTTMETKPPAAPKSTTTWTGPSCVCCTEPAKLTCTRCDSRQYCSVACQEADWAAHELLCATFKSFSNEKRPSQTMRRCIIFPTSGDKPKFVWLEVKEVKDDKGETQYKQPNVAKQMGTEAPFFNSILTNETTGVKLQEHIHLCYHEDANDRYDVGNKAVQKATAGMAKYPWRGPIVAYCGTVNKHEAEDPEADIIKVADMDMMSYSHVVAHLIGWQNNEVGYLALKGPKIQAVRALPNWALKLGKPFRFEAVTVPRMHPLIVRGKGEICLVSKELGMSLVLVKGRGGGRKSSNDAVATMMMRKKTLMDGTVELEEASAFWATKPVGQVFIFREDFDALSVKKVEDFMAFWGQIHDHQYVLTADEWDALVAKWKFE